MYCTQAVLGTVLYNGGLLRWVLHIGDDVLGAVDEPLCCNMLTKIRSNPRSVPGTSH